MCGWAGLTHRAAVNINHLSGDETGVVTEEESGESSDVIGFAPAFEGSFLKDALLPVFAGGFAPGRANPAGSDAVDTNERSEAECEGPGEAHDSVFGGGKQFTTIAFHTAVGLIPADGDDPAAACFSEVATSGAGEFDGAGEIGIEQCLEFLWEGGIAEFRCEQISAGVADEGMEGSGAEGRFEQI